MKAVIVLKVGKGSTVSMTCRFIHWIGANKRIFWFAGFAGVYIGYFLLQQFVQPQYIIHTALDDQIPFCEWFVIPYLLWYLYISIPLIVAFFKASKTDFILMSLLLFSGIAVSMALFALWPTMVDFRPTGFDRDNILIDLVRMIYAADRPTNVCPSLHCYEALAMHIGMVRSGFFKNSRSVLRPVSVLMLGLICLSTMFIKQHSVVDVAAGLVLAAPMYLLVYKQIMPLLVRHCVAPGERLIDG